MSIDLSQFHQVFFEESFEGLDLMESSLMALDPQQIDAEDINSIFRAAHSIKGGSATFGFSVVADFTHVLETLLDEIRDGRRAITQEHIDLFLATVDCLREILGALQNNEVPDAAQSTELRRQFEDILAGKASSAPVNPVSEPAADEPVEAVAEAAEHSPASGRKRWKINFRPGTDILATGNDVVRMFSELSELGSLSVTADTSAIPALTALNPEACYLSWVIELETPDTFTSPLSGAEGKEAIAEVFEWVADESDIDIQELGSSSAAYWDISFKPTQDILRTGNDPARMFALLAELGELTVHVDTSSIPTFSAAEPELCYLSWNIQLREVEQPVALASIEEVFEWVMDEAELSIVRHEPSQANVTAAAAGAAPGEPVAMAAASAEVDSGVAAPLASSPVLETGATNSPASLSPTAVETVAAATAKAPATNKTARAPEATSIRVDIDKIDTLINMVGELVITQSMLGQLGTEFDMDRVPKLIEGLSQLEQNTRELQESVMRIRMLPISFAFSRFPRMVRDLSKRLGKDIELVLQGEATELDKTVMEKIGDPLVHLVRNSVDHGIEMPDERRAAGKKHTGTVTLNAYHQGGNVVIEISDDGRGLHKEKIINKALKSNLITEAEALSFSDEQVYDLIFQPGFSTAAAVSDVSGRGVGMDVVRKNIQALNGTVEIKSSAGKGSKITIRLPLTLAILDGQLVKVGDDTYIIPLISIIESLQASSDGVNKVAGGCDVFQLRQEYVPIIRLYEVFGNTPASQILDESLLVVVESDGEHVGLVVDELLGQQQVVIKSLEQNYSKVEGISGATILGDGTVSLILDIPGVVRLAGIRHSESKKVATLAESHRNLARGTRSGAENKSAAL